MDAILTCSSLICSSRRRLLWTAAIFVAASVAAHLHAAPTNWTGGVGSWFNAGNWDGGVPISSQQAMIENGGTAQIFLPNAMSGHFLVRDGVLEIAQGGQLTSERGSLGWTTAGHVAVDGVGSLWRLTGLTNLETLRIGAFGEGALTISNGGKVEANGGFGVTMGYGSESNGSAAVTGSGSNLTTGSLDIGQTSGSVASLTVAEGATVISSSATLAVFAQSSGTVLVTGQNSTWQAGNLVVGRTGQGIVTIADGGLVSSSSAYMGQYGGKGTVLVTGEDSTWNLTNSLSVGGQGGGVLEIDAGAQVEVGNTTYVASGAKGKVALQNSTLTTRGLFASPANLHGQGTIFSQGIVGDLALQFDATHGLQQTFHFNDAPDQDVTLHLGVTGNAAIGVGRAEEGSLTIADGAKVPSLGGYLGMEAGSHGVANVAGSGSEWNSPGLGVTIGDYGTGELSVSHGGAVIARSLSLGNNQSGNGTLHVTGPMSTLKVNEHLRMGRDGAGEIVIEQGASVSSGSAWIAGDVSTPRGAPVPGVGDVTIAGAGSKWTIAGDLVVCYDGTANLTVTDGAQLASGSAVVGQQVGADGRVTISGPDSHWTSALLKIGGAGAATVAVNDAARLTVTQVITVGARGLLTGDGVVASTLVNGGVVAPGASTGSLHLEGTYSQLGGGELQIDLASTREFDALEVTGSASLKGRLAVNLVGDFTPSLNDAFPILTTTTPLTGRFNSLALPSLAPGLSWEIEYGATAVMLRIGALTADFNHDGYVDGDDLAIWKTAMSDGSPADANGDGQTDGGDFLAWQRQFQPASPIQAAVHVPEPTTLSLLLAVAILARGLKSRPNASRGNLSAAAAAI